MKLSATNQMWITISGLLAAVAVTHGADIFSATYRGDVATVGQMLSSNPALIEARMLDGRRPLHLAVSSGSKEMVELLLAHGAMVDSHDFIGITPLHVAAALGRVEIAAVLLNHGAAVNVRHRYGKTPLGAALTTNSPPLIVLLVKHGGCE